VEGLLQLDTRAAMPMTQSSGVILMRVSSDRAVIACHLPLGKTRSSQVVTQLFKW
jgi:hypothetical protein